MNRLKRLEGQVRGVERMVEKEDSLKDIFTQMKALRSALLGVEQALIEREFEKIDTSKDTVGDIQVIIKDIINLAR